MSVMAAAVTAEPSWVPEARTRKADEIARSLTAAGVTADAATRMDVKQRKAAAAQVGRPAPSDKTWRVVVEMLAGSRRGAAACQTCGLGNPEGEHGPPLPFGHDGECRR